MDHWAFPMAPQPVLHVPHGNPTPSTVLEPPRMDQAPNIFSKGLAFANACLGTQQLSARSDARMVYGETWPSPAKATEMAKG